MSQTQTITTEYGDVQVETVECDSCGNTIARDAAHEFTIGSRDGHACDYCVENGPISFPEKVYRLTTPTDELPSPHDADLGLLFHLGVAPLILPIQTFLGVYDGNEFEQGYATAIITILLWVGVPLLIWFVGIP